ncbi:MAG: uroporphyrinogen decarboxylase/cobalamine-independent methonine synthase family protein [Anaerolineae bacterium]
MNARENWLRAVEFRWPEWIPCSMSLAPAVWQRHGDALEGIVREHPRIFPDYQPPEEGYEALPVVYRQGEHYRDNWGCLWFNIQGGLEGQVVGHPLADWSALESYTMPDPATFTERGARDWAETAADLARDRAAGKLLWGSGERLFDRLYFLRGFENLMIDFSTEPPELTRLIAMLEAHEMDLIQRWLALGVDVVSFHTDFGAQDRLMIRPAAFRKHILPMFTRLFRTCRRAGMHVYLSSDGRLLDVVDDLIACGVSVHDPQLRANTLEGIVRAYKGRLCANVDLDRQGFPFMSPADAREQVKQVVDAMALSEGGLMLSAGIWGADVALGTIAALCEAMEDYCFPAGCQGPVAG